VCVCVCVVYMKYSSNKLCSTMDIAVSGVANNNVSSKSGAFARYAQMQSTETD